MKDATETTIIDAFLLGYLSHFRVPQVITTDQEAQFSRVICFLDSCNLWDVSVIETLIIITSLMVWMRIRIEG